MGYSIPPMQRIPKPTSPPPPRKVNTSEKPKEEIKSVGMDLITTVGTILVLGELFDGP